MKNVILALISLYQLVISPMLGNRCRFHPTCSEYAKEAVMMHGALHGSWCSICRLARCHPWNDGGFDPVPNKR
jgi:uncharacterized protein